MICGCGMCWFAVIILRLVRNRAEYLIQYFRDQLMHTINLQLLGTTLEQDYFVLAFFTKILQYNKNLEGLYAISWVSCMYTMLYTYVHSPLYMKLSNRTNHCN